jgi:hypothetical protein
MLLATKCLETRKGLLVHGLVLNIDHEALPTPRHDRQEFKENGG